MECTITRCEAEATTLLSLYRPTSVAASQDHAWTGHHETAYCGKHSIERPSAEGIERYGDTWTMKPLAA